MRSSPKNSNRGFTLIELLIVVAIIGIIAAVAIPNLLQAIHMARQKKSLSDLRTVATALAVYQNDNLFYPRIGNSEHIGLEPHLGPLPKKDGWGSSYIYQTSSTGIVYTIICYGSDREPDPPYIPGPISRHSDDIVFVDSNLLQWPDGTQSE